jgi:ABC-type glycerol-3-phosphate transport system permease component
VSAAAHRRRRRRSGNELAGHGVAQAVMIVVGVLTLYPLYFIVITAFKSRTEYLQNQFLPPRHPTLANFHAAFQDGELLRWLGNSVLITFAAVAVAAVVSALAAYPLARTRFIGRLPFIGLNIVLMVIPPVVLVVPLFLLSVDLGFVNSRLVVVIIYAGLLIPFSIYLLVNFFATIPRSLEEAVRIDGAGPLRTLRHVIVPLSAPAIVTVVVVNAVWVWNELLIALVFLQDDNKRTLMAGLTFFQGRFMTNVPLVMTGALIATIPMLLLYIVGQRFFIRGLAAGFGK